MGTYKVIQDIEAEDKLLGPLTLKQFIFAAITLTCLYLNFLSLTRGMSFLVVIFLPPMFMFGILAWPWSREQSTEVWLLAKLRFFFKPRRRIWDQAGHKELVTITAPVVENKHFSDGLSEGEVKSRLKALANTIDSRGWAVKNVNVNLFAQPSYATASASDRLIDPSSLSQQVNGVDVGAADDILDENNNPTAQSLDRMISATAVAHRQKAIQTMRQPAPADPTQQQTDYWFMNQNNAPIPAGQAVFDGGTTVRPTDASQLPAPVGGVSSQQAALAQLQKAQESAGYGNMRTIQPMAAAPAAAAPSTGSKTPDPAILKLASNDDLDVATIARQANKAKGLEDGEVVVPLR